jgi:AcrR family transcriptional regulator
MNVDSTQREIHAQQEFVNHCLLHIIHFSGRQVNATGPAVGALWPNTVCRCKLIPCCHCKLGERGPIIPSLIKHKYRIASKPRSRATVKNAAATKARIVKAAQEVFATRGYAQGMVRDIALSAGVAPSLIIRYFGSKDALFEIALAQSLDLTSMLSTSRKNYGRHAVSLLTERHANSVFATAMVVHSISEPHMREVAMRLLHKSIIKPLAEWMGPPNADVRAQLVAILTMGYSVFEILLPLNPPLSRIDMQLRKWMADALQGIADMDRS